MTLNSLTQDQIKEFVRHRYAAIAVGSSGTDCAPASSCSGSGASSCCGSKATPGVDDLAARMGYAPSDVEAAGQGNLGLGCGNPQAIADLRPGEVVVDLGSGAGFDCFLAARQVGASGRVIGVDMTHEMLARARANATQMNLPHVEFRLGEIEHLPVADNSADVIISNCVINLSPDKPQVFREAFRALKSGGRLAVSDVVLTRPLPPQVSSTLEMFGGCIGGAACVDDRTHWLAEAGFQDVRIDLRAESRDLIRDWAPGQGVEDYVVSAAIWARKP